MNNLMCRNASELSLRSPPYIWSFVFFLSIMTGSCIMTWYLCSPPSANWAENNNNQGTQFLYFKIKYTSEGKTHSTNHPLTYSFSARAIYGCQKLSTWGLLYGSAVWNSQKTGLQVQSPAGEGQLIWPTGWERELEWDGRGGPQRSEYMTSRGVNTSLRHPAGILTT